MTILRNLSSSLYEDMKIETQVVPPAPKPKPDFVLAFMMCVPFNCLAKGLLTQKIMTEGVPVDVFGFFVLI